MPIISKISSFYNVIFLFLLLYVYVYNPYINALNIQSIRLLYPVALIVIAVHFRLFCRLTSLCYKELGLLLLCILFTIFHTLFGGDSSFTNVTITLFFDGYLLSFSVYLLIVKLSQRFNIVDLLYSNAVIAALFSLVLLLSPDAKDFVLQNFNSIDEDKGFLQYRCFGISSGLTFDYSIFQGLALIFCVIYKKTIWNFILIPIFIISILFNARIGIIAPLFVIIYLMIIKFRIKLWLAVFSLIILFQVVIQTDFYDLNMTSFLWLEDGYEELISNLMGNTDDTTLGTLGTMFFFPDSSIEWIIGTGKNIFSSRGGNNSDIGYCIQLMYGGVIYFLLLSSWLVNAILSTYRFSSKSGRQILFFILILLVICNYKGNVLFSNCVTRSLMLMCVAWKLNYLILYKSSAKNPIKFSNYLMK